MTFFFGGPNPIFLGTLSGGGVEGYVPPIKFFDVMYECPRIVGLQIVNSDCMQVVGFHVVNSGGCE